MKARRLGRGAKPETQYNKTTYINVAMFTGFCFFYDLYVQESDDGVNMEIDNG